MSEREGDAPLVQVGADPAPPVSATLPPSASRAVGVTGSEPGRSLPSGLIVIGLPTSPATMSGSATPATAWRSFGSCTWKVSSLATGSPMPSETAYSTVTWPPLAGAVKRTRPLEVTRAAAPLRLAAHGLGGGDGDRVAVLLVPPVGQHRHVEHAARRHRPVPVLEPLTQVRSGVGRAGARRHRHRGVGRDLGPAVVDVVLEGRGRRVVVGHGQLEGLAVGADGHLGVGTADLLDRADRQDPATRRGVVVERVEHGRAARARAEAVRLGLRRPPVALVLLLVLVVLVVLLDPGPEVLPVVHPGRLLGVDVPDPAAGPVVEHDLAAVDPEHQVGGGTVELGHVGLAATTDRGHGPGAAGPGAVDAVAETDRGRRPPGDAVDDGADVAGVEVHLEQRVAGRDQDRSGIGSGLLEHRLGGYVGAAAADHVEGTGVEHHGGVPDRGHGDGLADVTGKVVRRPVEARSLRRERGEGVLAGRGDQHPAGPGHGQGGIVARGGDGGRLHVEATDRRAPFPEEPGVPTPGRPRDRRRPGSPPDSATCAPPGTPACSPFGMPHLRRVDRRDQAIRAVDADHGAAVLDDVEGGRQVGEDHAVELADGLVDPAVEAAAGVGDPDPAVVQPRVMGAVAVG